MRVVGTQAPPTQPGILESARKERDLVDVITLRGYAHESLYLLLGIKYGYACVRRWWLESVQSGQPGGTDFSVLFLMLDNADVPPGFTRSTWKTVDLGDDSTWPSYPWPHHSRD